MRIPSGIALIALIVLIAPLGAHAQTMSARTTAASSTDWGGGYLRDTDSASVTVATSGAGTAKPASAAILAAPAPAPLTDWGGGYRRGADSASTTVATSGAGTPKPAH